MANEMIGVIGIAVLLGLILLRVPIGAALIGVSVGGIWTLLGSRPALGILATVPYDFVAKWTLSSVPMFLLMGFICYHAGLTRGLFEACKLWLARLPGGLAIASIFGASGFAAVTGSSVACAAAMGRIAVPEMMRQRYDAALATGTVAAAGTIGALIPPSILMIIYGVFVQQPIGGLFLGGIGAGLLTAASYIVVVILHATLKPGSAPRVLEVVSFAAKLAALRQTWPILALIVCVLGGLFSGLFTATEAGAVGAFLALVIAAANRSLDREVLRNSVKETLATSAAIFVIAIGANLLTRFMALSGAGTMLSRAVIGLDVDPLLLIVAISLIYLLIGMFLEPIGAMLLTLPVLLPVLISAKIDLLWFGVFLTKFLEIGMITPPIGINVFVIKGVVGNLATTTTIFRGIMWFLAADLVVVALLVAFPGIITWLPRMLF